VVEEISMDLAELSSTTLMRVVDAAKSHRQKDDAVLSSQSKILTHEVR
jgi:hypothetical protein